MDSKFKFLLVSDKTTFALTEVWSGYGMAFKQLGIAFDTYPMHKMRTFFNPDFMNKHIHSQLLDSRFGYTHLLSINGTSISSWLLDSTYDKKTICISTEDPHSLDVQELYYDKYDYYFTNEKNVTKPNIFPNSRYLPTAGSIYECKKIDKKIIPKEWFCDILFIGCVYPNRADILEKLVPLVEKNGYKFHILGLTDYMVQTHPKSPLWKYVVQKGVIDHKQTVCRYNGAKIVINMKREEHWNYEGLTDGLTRTATNLKYKVDGRSLNPRAYEVPMSGTFMLIDNSRKEVFDVFGKSGEQVGIYKDGEDLADKVAYYLQHEKRREVMTQKAYENVVKNHTYLNRAKKLIEFLEEDRSINIGSSTANKSPVKADVAGVTA